MNSSASPEIIRTNGVTKKFGEVVAVNQVDYTLHENEIAGIIGSNGAGKTTFFNLLTGYYAPDEGSVFYKGEEITRLSPKKRVAMGMMRTFQLTSTFDNLTVMDNLILSFFRAYKKASLAHMFFTTRQHHRNDEKIAGCLETFDLDNVSNRMVRQLSLGEKRRLEIAMSILAEPKVLLLDEPLAGLSEAEIAGILEILKRHAHRQTILIVEHKISKVQDFIERLTVMHEGRVIADGPCEECLKAPAVRKSYWQIDHPEK
ncbi:MAG: ABC transporter ATP-binding protein [Pseudomonadota bacterium]